MANVMLEMFRRFLFGISSDSISAFEFFVL